MTESSGAEANLAKAWDAFKGYGQYLAAAATAVFSAIWSAHDQLWTDGIWWFVATLVAGVATVAHQIWVQKPSYVRLSADKRDAEARSKSKTDALENAMESLLRLLAGHCSVNGDTDRASVYYFHSGRFVMTARWSANPPYKLASRESYPARQGVIGATWAGANGSDAMLASLPPTARKWLNAMRGYGYSEDEANRIRMKSVRLVGVRIKHQHTPVGVLILETTDESKLPPTTIENVKTSPLFDVLSELVAVASEMTTRGETLIAEVDQSKQEKPQRAAPPWQNNATTGEPTAG